MRLEESTLSYVASAYGAKDSDPIDWGRKGVFLRFYLGPTTETQAAACLRIWISLKKKTNWLSCNLPYMTRL